MKVNQSAVLLSALPIILLGFAFLTAVISDFESVIGIILCLAASLSSLERTITHFKEEMAIICILYIHDLDLHYCCKTLPRNYDLGLRTIYFPASE